MPHPRPIDASRRATFLDVLRRTGSFPAAAKAASPHLEGSEKPGQSSFRTLAKVDPLFAAEVEEARAEFVAKLEERAREIALEGEADAPNVRVLLRLLERFDPDAWAPQQKHLGTITHVAAAPPGSIAFTADDIAALNSSDREEMVRLLQVIDANRAAPPELPADIEVRP